MRWEKLRAVGGARVNDSRPLRATSIIVVVMMAALAVAQAQDGARPPAKRTILQQTDVASNPAQETIFATVDIAPGSGNPFHSHNGSEMGYVLAGHIRLEIKGQPSRELGPGDSFLILRNMIHRSVLIGDQPVKLLNTWTVDKGKPLLNLAPAN